MILLWGLCGDGPFDAVTAALQRRGVAFCLIDQRRVLQTGVELRSDAELGGSLHYEGQTHELNAMRAVYWRTHDLRRVPEVVEAEALCNNGAALRAAYAVEQALVIWLEMTAACVVSRPSNMASNGSKPYQMGIIKAHGFDVPDTLITTDPQAAKRFWTDKGAVIYKSVSGTRSIVSRLSNAHLSRLDDVAWCPTQFQQFVPGRDYRVHVVGEAVFASEILSDAEDYRYAARHGEPAELRAAQLPAEIETRCVALAHAMGLPLAGIDLRCTPDDRWFCFEVNPSPGFTYYEAHTGQPIADAIAGLLIAATTNMQ